MRVAWLSRSLAPCLFLLLVRPPPWWTLFPCTTLFRSLLGKGELPSREEYDRFCTKINHRTMVGEDRSEEHTSELQSRGHLVCCLLLEKKNSGKSSSCSRVNHIPPFSTVRFLWRSMLFC